MSIDAAAGRITFARPALPDSIDCLQLTNLVVGAARVDLRLERHPRNVAVSVVRRDGDVEVVAIT